MNERIRELAEQARVQDRGYFIYQYGDPISHQSVEKAIDLEKFAELIVQECANIVNSLEQHKGPGDCATVDYIKEHFGVE